MPSSEALKRAKKRYYEKVKNTEQYQLKMTKLQQDYYEANRERVLARVKAYQAKKKEVQQNIVEAV